MAEPGKKVGARNRVFDVQPPGAEKDPEYAKFKKELEEAGQGGGWLTGPFDRQDIAYLRELKEGTRNTEDELDQGARSEFERLRSQSEAEIDAALRQPGMLIVPKKLRKEIKPISKLLPFKVSTGPAKISPRGSSELLPARSLSTVASGLCSQPSCGIKRPRPDNTEELKPVAASQASMPSGPMLAVTVGDLDSRPGSEGLAGLLGYSDSEEEEK